MTLLQCSLVMTRATNTHSQLRYLATLNQDQKFKTLLKTMDTLYELEDNSESKQLMKNFLDEHSDEIYKKATQQNDDYQTHYELKDD